MRRKMKSNISFFLVFMVASFTLLSYIFDQLAIGQEDRLRMKIINQSNLDAKINHIDSTYNQILDIHNSNNKIIGCVHAGWKGAINKIIENTISKIRRINSNNKIFASIGPCIGKKSYEVGFNFYKKFITL